MNTNLNRNKSTLAHSFGVLLMSCLCFSILPVFAEEKNAPLTDQKTRENTQSTTSANESPTRGLLFEIKSGNQRAYLFGSIHIAKADFYPMSSKVEAAYRQADTVAIEADTSDTQAVQAMMPKLSYLAPDKLENHLSSTTWTSLKAVFGPALEQMQAYKPFVVTSGLAVQIGMQMGYEPKYGIDLHFIQRAKSDKKALVELESLAFQADVLGGLSDEEGDALLSSTIESLKKQEFLSELDHIVKAWKAADAAAIAKLFVDSANKDPASKKMMKMLMDDRNEGMAAKINQLLGSGKKLFVVVGAGHLAGEKSIVDLLRKQGIEVNQIR
ncbi:TraB/GumN family protein [Undibacterium fentianense]|uniref:TraB/GumN family protein n=1 Tax=Undibacterium fentianense TaxID=2828728 RepID=A0A941DYS6_9BURK|nr:TraB/GumN family protein [Undibacterium fentianense]MBR7799944.1 TraB/GumN family protein [Undibacterium fentianense]